MTEPEAEALVAFIRQHDGRFTASSSLCTPWRPCPCVVLAQGKTPGGRTRALVFHRTKDYIANAEAEAADAHTLCDGFRAALNDLRGAAGAA